MHAPTAAVRAADAIREVNIAAGEVPSTNQIACKR
jgi:flagellar biosynthesis/type III secretory pathway ATPase